MMNEEHEKIQLLRTAAHDRETEEGSPWEKLAAGELTEEEHAALRREAEQSEEGRRLYELYRPFDASEKQRLFEGVRAQVQRDARRRRNQAIIAGSMIATAAAAAMVPVYVRGRHAPLQVEVALSGSLGSQPDRVTQLDTPDAELSMTIVPVGAIEGRLEIRKALLVHDGQPTAWDAHPNPTSPDNKIRIVGVKKDLFPCLPAGEWTILVAVGTPGETPSDADMMRLADKGSAGSYQVLSKRVWLGGPPTPSDGTSCPGARP